jgi:hypothetical protein
MNRASPIGLARGSNATRRRMRLFTHIHAFFMLLQQRGYATPLQ